ncbi:hypothetical protein AC15_4145 [Escherichia coli 2-156-04_S3_C2]|nr:hypothetical protein AC15_4145 [Escherichia coli 2-156-04_S3_C2]
MQLHHQHNLLTIKNRSFSKTQAKNKLLRTRTHLYDKRALSGVNYKSAIVAAPENVKENELSVDSSLITPLVK